MPFKSKAQMKKAFSGGMGKEMQEKAQQWADETPNIDRLPERVHRKKAGKTVKSWRNK